jgi:hypothetical protein
MKYEIYDSTQVEAVDWDGDGTNGSYWIKTGETPYIQVTLMQMVNSKQPTLQ